MRIQVGQWWSMDDRGQGTAHRVGALIPDLLAPTPPLAYDHSSWIPLCACGVPETTKDSGARLPRQESATLFSTHIPDADHPRCSTCEVMSPALDHWLDTQHHQAEATRR